MNLVALFQEELGQVAAILSSTHKIATRPSLTYFSLPYLEILVTR